MSFKADTSFLRFLTMGALGVRATMARLKEDGFEPIELERYCTSNKIWATKVKRLRLPDVLCVSTGLRVEVRAKSKLKIRMSDAPNNPDRRWDAGLRDDDVVAFVACESGSEQTQIIGPPVFFLVSDLRASVKATKLGAPKSASEGAERDREWMSCVPTQHGEVVEVTRDKIIARLASNRRQTYHLRGKTSYVQPGDRFVGRVSIVASVVPRLAPLPAARRRSWDPPHALTSPDAVDRYAAAKAIPYWAGAHRGKLKALLASIDHEADDRVALEMAASAGRLGAEWGMKHLVSTVWNHDRGDLRMEAVLILAELDTVTAARELVRVATAAEFTGDEVRQAATWGLGKAGCRRYSELVDLLDDGDDSVVLHAIAGFGPDTPAEVVASLVNMVAHGAARERAAASESLRLIGSEVALRELVNAARSGGGQRAWILATLGRLDASTIRRELADDALLAAVEPLLALGPAENWLAAAETSADLRFLLLQEIPH